jgi:putative drug exporter of the RND superfamily
MATILPDAERPTTTDLSPEVPQIPPIKRGFGVRYAAFVLRFRWAIVAVWTVAIVASLPFTVHVTDHLTTGGFSWNGSESIKADNIIQSKFGTALPTATVVFRSTNTPVSDPAYQAELARFEKAAQGFKTAPNVLPVASVTPGPTGADGRTTYVTVAFNLAEGSAEDAMASFHHLLPTSGPAKAYLSGDTAAYAQISTITQSDLSQAEDLTLPLAGLALLLIFGTLVSTAIPLGMAIVVIPITLAIIYAISLQTTMSIYVINVSSVIGLGLSIDYSLFLVRRFRDELHAGRTPAEAVTVMLTTSGEAILFSGLTVLIGFSGLVLVGLPFMTSIAIGGVTIVGVAVLGALTLVPAVLSLLGHRVIQTRIPRPWRRATTVKQTETNSFWHRWALTVMRHPIVAMIGVLAILFLIASPLLSIQLGLPDTQVLPPTNEARQGLNILTQQFPDQQSNQMALVLQTRDGSPMLAAQNIEQLCAFSTKMSQVKDVSATIGLTSNPTTSCQQYAALYSTGAFWRTSQLAQLVQATTNGDTTIVTLQTKLALDSIASKNLLHTVRGLEAGAPFAMSVTGIQAISVDLGSYLYGNFPKSLIFILVATYIVLLIMFRSVFLPLKAVVMNILSVSAAYGVLVFVFQQGNLHSQLEFLVPGYVDMTTPILLFCILFGLSMDYEVFLLSRIREEWQHTHDNRYAVARGLEKTAGVITSAALMIMIVSGAFIFTHLTLTKEIGMGIAVAVIVDATIIRIVLVPATMRLLGKWNWWFPFQKPKTPVPVKAETPVSLN